MTISRKLVELQARRPLPMQLEDLVVGDWDLPGLLAAVHRARVPGPRREGEDEDAAVATTWSSCRRPRPTPLATVERAHGHAGRRARARRSRSSRPRRSAAERIGDHGRARSRAHRARAAWSRWSSRCRASRRRTSRSAIATSARLRRRRRRSRAAARGARAIPTVAKICHDAKTVIRAFADRRRRRSRASSRTRCSRRSCSIRPRRPSRARRSRSGSAACCCRRARRSPAARRRASRAIEVERAAPWAGAIAHALLPIAERAADAARRRRASTSLYRDIELPVARLLAEVERVGIHIDVAHFRKLVERGRRRGSPTLERQIYELAGGEFNIGSPKQLGELLFEKLGLETKGVRRTKTGWSTEADTLEQLEHPIIAPILEHREISEAQGHVPRRAAAAGLAEDRARPHHVQPGRRRDRPHLVAGSEPPEHPDPHASSACRSGAASSRRRATC